MLKQFSGELYARLSKELEGIRAKETQPLKRLSGCLAAVKTALEKLKDWVKAHPLVRQEDEIECFKVVKPRFYALLIYYVEAFNLENRQPVGTPEMLKSYYEGELGYFGRLFRQYAFYYEYFRLGMEEMDGMLFVRGAEIQQTLLPEVPQVDPDFATGMDYLFAKFIAYERLQQEVTEKIKRLNPAPAVVATGKTRGPFKWTGEVINLIENAHGILLTGQVNNGEVGIVEFFNGMGEFFGVDLGIPKKGLEALMKRKKLSKTHFTGRMQDKLNERMDAELDLEREKRRKNKMGI